MRSAGRQRDQSGARGAGFEARRLGFRRAAEGFHGSISLSALPSFGPGEHVALASCGWELAADEIYLKALPLERSAG